MYTYLECFYCGYNTDEIQNNNPVFELCLEKQKLFARCLKFMLGLQGFLKHIYKVCETFCPALSISSFAFDSFLYTYINSACYFSTMDDKCFKL